MQYSIVNYSTIDKILFRLEAEFYKKSYTDIEKQFSQNPKLNDHANRIVCGPFGSTILDETYTGSGIKVIRPFNIKTYQIEEDNIVHIPNEDVKNKQLKEFSYSTIFFARVGDVKCGVFTRKEKVTISPNILAVEIKQSSYNPFFLTLFFNSKYGLSQLLRETKVLAQPTISTRSLKKLKLPLIDISFQNHIGSIFEQTKKINVLREKKYQQAYTLLLSELGLINWQPKHRLTFVKNYSDTQKAGRIDADYYQPKYDEVINAITNYSGGWDVLTQMAKLQDTNFNPKDKQKYRYIELANIMGNGGITDCMIEEGQDLPTRARRRVATGDVIVSSIEGSSSSIALIDSEYNQALCSTGFHVITPTNLNPETLLVLLKSVVGQLQIRKGCSGTILTSINKKEFGNIILPKIKKVTQSKIKQKVIQSFKLREQSKRLLECAKRAVEIAIEKNEKQAMKWLEKEISRLKTI